ncbi:MAG: MMPL family transporter [Candidatus Marinimicrobia bacterium]|nr:MMPL family transporter [Candidatus Neomarinimicrobiota bacterium]
MPPTRPEPGGPAGWIVRHPLYVLLYFLVAVGALGWQARKFRVDASADTLLMRGNRHYMQTQVMHQRFAPREFLLIAYAPTNHSVFSKQTFDDLKSIRGELRGLERVAAVRSLLDAPLLTLATGDLTTLDPSAWTVEQRSFSMETLRRALTDHPIYEQLLINRDQTAVALQVLFKADPELSRLEERITDLQRQALQGKLSPAKQRERRRLRREADPLYRRLDTQRRAEVSAIRKMLRPYEGRANLYLGGLHVVGFQLVRIIRNDLVVFGGAIAAMIAVILLALFRRIRWVVIPAVCCTCSLVATLGLFGMLGFKTTVISANFVVLQLILTLAIVVHLIVQYREYNRQHSDWEQPRLVTATLRRKAAPCLYAGLTTSVGFASLLASELQPVISFGWMMIIAMFCSIGVSLALFPALMALFPRESARGQLGPARWLLKGCSTFTLRAGWLAVPLGAGVLAAGAVGALRLDVENSFLNYFRDSTRVHKELAFIDRHFGGSTPLDLVITLPDDDKPQDLVLQAQTVQQLQRVQQALQRHEAVGKILSAVNLTALAKEVNDSLPLTEYELTALYRTLEASLRETLLGPFLALEHRQARISMRIQDTTPGLKRSRLLADIRQDLKALGYPESRYVMTNLFVLYENILQRLLRSQATTLGIVYGVLFVAFWGIFRSLRVALAAMIPNLLATAVVLGAMGWLQIPLDLMTITIAAVAMGIAVDDTIHYTHRYLEELKAHSPSDAVRRTHDSVGFAVLYTTLIITLGFSLMILSDFTPSALFGLLSGLARVTALVADLCILPVLLRWFVRPN